MPPFRTVLSGLSGMSLRALTLGLRSPAKARDVIGATVRHANRLEGKGLQHRDPVTWLLKERGAPGRSSVTLPLPFVDDGGTRPEELARLGAVAALLQPKRIFEIGTFRGLTTLTFALNAPKARVFTLDLPEDAVGAAIPSDAALIQRRKVGARYLAWGGLTDHITQLYGDSKQFDPTPYRHSIDLGFIDGAHSRDYVENDTRLLCQMLKPEGLLFWHDYGGTGWFAGLSEYLESIGRAVFRIGDTSLAWAEARAVQQVIANT